MGLRDMEKQVALLTELAEHQEVEAASLEASSRRLRTLARLQWEAHARTLRELFSLQERLTTIEERLGRNKGGEASQNPIDPEGGDDQREG